MQCKGLPWNHEPRLTLRSGRCRRSEPATTRVKVVSGIRAEPSLGRGGRADRGTSRRSLQQDWGVATGSGRPRERKASEATRLWATKKGVSNNFYDPEDVQTYLDSIQSQSMDTTDSSQPLRPSCDNRDTSSPTFRQEGPGRIEPDHRPRGRDLDRLAKTHNARGQILQAVALHTQLSDRDKSRSPLQPTTDPT
ncbi:hypothetical protein NDU88_002950 [Pleurodeles waltl]|uniref:Uncharacterized protein n=1 Tax=Pleurodeles waltl TaxID=8319 RepID=A0AAV7W0S6_PLEWA|nr:hypothetical protein NDU88_002950 [Pleurodeles waltl]